MRYDVIIVGAGPAGIFAALELVKEEKFKILILEKGKDIDERIEQTQKLKRDIERGVPSPRLCGWGGAGAFSDGKLILSSEVGGLLSDYLPTPTLNQLIGYVDEIYVRFGAPSEIFAPEEDEIRELQRNATLADMQLIPTKVRHLGTERCPAILQEMKRMLHEKLDIKTDTEVQTILTENDKVCGVETNTGERFEGDYVIVAPGRQGSEWLSREAKRLNLQMMVNPVDVGVRVEVPAAVPENLTSRVYEPKFVFYSKSFDDKVRTFCVCPHGEVVAEYNNGVVTVNGHSYAGKPTENTNFALLVSTTFTQPFQDPIAYGRYLASLANLISDGVIVQRLGDLMAGRRSTADRVAKGLIVPTLDEATPGDLSFVLPYRYLSSILEMLDAIDRLAPGVNSRHTLLYGVEVKFYSSRLKLTKSFETEISNLFAAGDGAGITRGLVQASVCGVIVAREIIKRTR